MKNEIDFTDLLSLDLKPKIKPKRQWKNDGEDFTSLLLPSDLDKECKEIIIEAVYNDNPYVEEEKQFYYSLYMPPFF